MAAILFPVFSQAREKARATACMSNMKLLSTGMLMYAQDYDGHLPDRRNWGDAVSVYVKNPRAYQCPSLSGQRGTYAFNGWLSRVSMNRLDSPTRTVAGFDSRSGWNLAGGPELADARHNQGLYVMFADGRVQWRRDFSGVVWKPRPPAAGRSATGRSRSRRGR
jgi:prepilin-type processing-associated H-X9-DG protein